MPIDSKFYKQKKSRSFYYAIAFLGFVILLTAGLYFYNANVVSWNVDLDWEISRLDTSIKKLNADENIKAYSLYVSNKDTFDTLTAQSQIPKFVKHIKTATRSLDLWGFSYSDGKIAMKFTSESDTTSQSYQKVIKFLKSYRENEENMFTLDTIWWVTGQDKITFNANFELKK